MGIKERIEKIQQYFIGMEMKGGLYIVQIQYPPKWGAYPNANETIKVAASETDVDTYFYYADFNTIDLNDVFDLIESTIKNNIEASEKLELLEQKFNELKTLFADESLERLKTLEFVLKTPKKKSKAKVKKQTKKVEPTFTLDTVQEEDINTQEEVVESC